MMELPEARVLADQINAALSGKRIASVTAGHTPHKLAWYYGDKTKYGSLLEGRALGRAEGHGSLVEIQVGSAAILLGEGVSVRFHARGEARPSRHQFLVEFTDGSALSAAVQMYGGMGAFPDGQLDNPYYLVAKAKPSPFSSAFDAGYFIEMISRDEAQTLSLKAFLATGQRIPGLGNGVLQDILFNARMHPRRKVGSLSKQDRKVLFEGVKGTLARMAEQGGRDTEMDLLGRPGGYRTILSKLTVHKPCPCCRASIEKEAYMGGTVYCCPRCQAR